MAITLRGEIPTPDDLPILRELYKAGILAANEWREEAPQQLRDLNLRRAIAAVPITAVYANMYALLLCNHWSERLLFTTSALLHFVFAIFCWTGAKRGIKEFADRGRALQKEINDIRDEIARLEGLKNGTPV